MSSYTPLEVIEAYKPEILTFNSPNEFNIYYQKHKSDFNNMSTYKLNVKYKIPGYKITQVGADKVLKLIKDYRSTHENVESNRIANIEKCIQVLAQDIVELTQRLNVLSNDK